MDKARNRNRKARIGRIKRINDKKETAQPSLFYRFILNYFLKKQISDSLYLLGSNTDGEQIAFGSPFNKLLLHSHLAV